LIFFIVSQYLKSELGIKNFHARVDVPLDAMEIDCSGGTVLPELIDTHLHFVIGLGDNYVEKFENSDDVQLAVGVVNARARENHKSR